MTTVALLLRRNVLIMDIGSNSITFDWKLTLNFKDLFLYDLDQRKAILELYLSLSIRWF
jgi:hypothetical protein